MQETTIWSGRRQGRGKNGSRVTSLHRHRSSRTSLSISTGPVSWTATRCSQRLLRGTVFACRPKTERPPGHGCASRCARVHRRRTDPSAFTLDRRGAELKWKESKSPPEDHGGKGSLAVFVENVDTPWHTQTHWVRATACYCWVKLDLFIKAFISPALFHRDRLHGEDRADAAGTAFRSSAHDK